MESRRGIYFPLFDFLIFNMTYSEIKNICKKGKTGMIPGWTGYLKWNYTLDQL